MQRESKQGHQWGVADTLTMVRIVGSFVLLALPVQSHLFFALYALIGLTDVLDGWREGRRQPARSARDWTVLRMPCISALLCSV